jgi:hypothetical protein
LLDVDGMGLRPEALEDVIERKRIEAENNEKEEAKLAEMTPREKKRYLSEQKRKEQIEADLAPEKMLCDEMILTKAKVDVKTVLFERLRGFVTLEDDKT